MGERHVVPDRGAGGWKVIGAHTGATEERSTEQHEAVEAACEQLRRSEGGDVLIHGLDGTVQERRTVSPDA